MKTIDWYLHNDSDFVGILESLEGYELEAAVNDTLANEIQDKFYEVGFDVDYDETY